MFNVVSLLFYSFMKSKFSCIFLRHEVESEPEEPEDAIKELGLVVHPESALK